MNQFPTERTRWRETGAHFLSSPPCKSFFALNVWCSLGQSLEDIDPIFRTVPSQLPLVLFPACYGLASSHIGLEPIICVEKNIFVADLIVLARWFR